MMKKGFLISATLCVSLSCQATEYFIDPVFNTNERYNSNLFMLQSPLHGNWISTLSPALNVGLRHENGELKSNFTWNELLYNNEPTLDIAEQLFGLTYQHKYQHFNYNLTGSYNNQSSINSESTTNGLLHIQVMSKRLNLAPSITYSIDELNSLLLNYSYNDATYAQSQSNVYLSNYTSQQASTSLNHIYSERDTFTTSLSGTLYETQPQSTLITKQTTHNYVSQLGWQHRFSEQLSTSVSAGINYSQAESQTQVAQLRAIGINGQGNPVYVDPTISSANNPFGLTLQQRYSMVTTHRNNFGQVYSASIQKTFERGSVGLSASQNQSPTSVGLQTQQVVSINTAATLNERWTSGVSASYTKSDLAGQASNSTNRTYYTLSPNINWKYTPEINLGLSYTYQQLEYQGSTQPSLGNIVQLQFSYQPKINLR